jgi:hypothetical protein
MGSYNRYVEATMPWSLETVPPQLDPRGRVALRVGRSAQRGPAATRLGRRSVLAAVTGLGWLTDRAPPTILVLLGALAAWAALPSAIVTAPGPSVALSDRTGADLPAAVRGATP